MKSFIGKMRHRVQLIYKKIIPLDNGEFEEKQIIEKACWARVIPLNLDKKQSENEWNQMTNLSPEMTYKVIMRKNNSRNALQADLVGIIFKSKVHKTITALLPSEDEQWVQALIIYYGVKNG